VKPWKKRARMKRKLQTHKQMQRREKLQRLLPPQKLLLPQQPQQFQLLLQHLNENKNARHITSQDLVASR
jgi:hypothetical protein